MDKFIREYRGHKFDDWGTTCSDDFKSFARKFRSYLARNLQAGANVVKHSCNHYDLSGFVKSENIYIYYSYSWNRFDPVDVFADDCRNGVLIRFAACEKDFRGEGNQFTSLENLPAKINSMIRERREAA